MSTWSEESVFHCRERKQGFGGKEEIWNALGPEEMHSMMSPRLQEGTEAAAHTLYFSNMLWSCAASEVARLPLFTC